MEDSPSIPSHAHGRGGEAVGASRRGFHCPASPSGMAGPGSLFLSIVNSSWTFKELTQKSELFDLIDILPVSRVDLICIKEAVQVS